MRPDVQAPDDPADLNGDTILFHLQPGTSTDAVVDLTKLYDISAPGVFTFEAEHLEEDNKSVVHSNAVVIRVSAK